MSDYFKTKVFSHTKSDFNINSLPLTRRELYKKIFFTRFGKLFQVNVLCFIFFLPLILWSLFTSIFKTSLTSVGDVVNFIITIKSPLVILFTMLAFIGLAGGIYYIRKLSWGEPVSLFRTFFTGVKQSYKQFLFFGFIGSFFVVLFDLAISMMIFSKLSYLDNLLFIALLNLAAILLFSIGSYAVTLSSLYMMKMTTIIKTSIAFTIKKLLNNVLLVLITYMFILFWFLIGIIYLYFLGIVLVGLLGLSYTILTWVLYTNSSYDVYINIKQYPAIYRKGLRPLMKEGAPRA